MDHARHMLGLKTDSMLELTYTERKRVHNLKYYTWVEQQGMTVEDLNAQWSFDLLGLLHPRHQAKAAPPPPFSPVSPGGGGGGFFWTSISLASRMHSSAPDGRNQWRLAVRRTEQCVMRRWRPPPGRSTGPFDRGATPSRHMTFDILISRCIAKCNTLCGIY